jgi:hypothetical protein
MNAKDASTLLAGAMMRAIQDSPAAPAIPELLAKLVTAAILGADFSAAEKKDAETSLDRPRARHAAAEGQQLLPFAEREYIDVARACHILGVSSSTFYVLHEAGLIEVIGYAPHKQKRVRYQSIVDLCDRLRQRHCIRDRRPRLATPHLRHRDADLLPFPLDDTITIDEAAAIMGYRSAKPVRHMIEEGRFEAYQFSPERPWRISRSSLAAYIDSARHSASAAASRDRAIL